MAIIPAGVSAAATQIRNSNITRPAFLTYGVDNNVTTDPQVIANSAQTAFASALATSFDTSCTLGPTTVRVGTGDEPLSGVSSIANTLGTRSGVATAPNTALLVQKVTARGGRRGRGRLFLPWVLVQGTDLDEAGIVLSSRLTALQTSLSAWLAALQSNGVAMTLLHSAGQTAPGSPDAVTALIPSALIATQRRRLGR